MLGLALGSAPALAASKTDSADALARYQQERAACMVERCVEGIEVNSERTQKLLSRSLMLLTSLVPYIGYDSAAEIAKHAQASGLGLRQAAPAVGGVSAEEFDTWVDPRRMLGPG
jgi:fumarate hydratase class II